MILRPLVCGSSLAPTPTSTICYWLHLEKHIEQGETLPKSDKYQRQNFDAFNVLHDQLQRSLQIGLLSSIELSNIGSQVDLTSLQILSSSGPGPGPRSGPGQVQKVQGLRTKDLDLGLTLNLVCHPPPLTTSKLFLAE